MTELSLLTRYFPELSSETLQRFETLRLAYLDWNQKINVISRKDTEHLVEHHFLHSLSVAKFVQFLPGSVVMDLGTGGGFPVVPLALLFPEVKFHAVDSIRKKISVVQEVCQAVGISNLSTHWMRAEDFKPKVDFVITRAVAAAAQLEAWTKGKYTSEHRHPIRNGLIALKGGDLEEETNELKGDFVSINLYDYFPRPFFETKKILYLPK